MDLTTDTPFFIIRITNGNGSYISGLSVEPTSPRSYGILPIDCAATLISGMPRIRFERFQAGLSYKPPRDLKMYPFNVSGTGFPGMLDSLIAGTFPTSGSPRCIFKASEQSNANVTRRG